MELRKLLDEDRGVSPVIGVILMVAITVILAAVIASFVLGMGPNTASTPTATFDSEYDSSTGLVVTMQSGETLDATKLSFSADTLGDISNGAYDDSTETWEDVNSGDVTAGDSITINVDSDDEVDLIYTDGDTTSTMQTFST